MYRHFHPRFIIMTEDQLQLALHESIIQVASLQNCYSRLVNLSPNQEHGNFLAYLIREELQILNTFKDLYTRYLGPVPQYDIRNYEYSDYANGLSKAIDYELERIRFCREMVLQLTGQEEYRGVYDYYHDSAIRHATHLDIVTMLYNQTFDYIPPS